MATAKETTAQQTTPTPAHSSAGPGAPSEPVRQFGKYFLVRKLAEGGMAEIFLAKLVGAEGFERDVVIKRMLKHLSSVTDFVNMFLDEAKLAARLVHPNVIQINELGQSDGCYFICMEYLPGEDFSTIIRTSGRKREYVPLAVIARVMADAAHGLHFAHEFSDASGKPMGIVHRDISPSNIYVTYQGQVKVLDFGIAKAESRITNTTAGVVKGKYMYMAPEQARGQRVDRRADVFSLGVSLYEALTHYRPFSRENDLAILNAVLRCEFKAPRELRKDLPPELEAIILKAMAAKPEDRYPTAGALAGELERFLGTSSSGGTNVGVYMRSLFGDERVSFRSKIPSLADLAQAGVAVPGFNPEAKTQAGQDAGQSDPNVPKLRPPSGAGPDKTAMARPADLPARRGGAGLLAAGVALGLVAFGGAFAALRYLGGTPPAAAAPVPGGPAPAAVAPDPPPVAPGPAPEPPAAAASTVPAPGPAPGPSGEEGEGPVTVRQKKKPARPVQLDPVTIQKVVSRGSASILQCFDSHKEDLPSDRGQASVKFTILGSGKVTAPKAVGGLAGTRVGGCLEQRVSRLSFPPHVDREITITVPFQYQVKR